MVDISVIDELLRRQDHHGQLLVQCREHMNRHITRRPPMCTLCRTDQIRALERAMKVNEFLTQWKHDATIVIKDLRPDAIWKI